ncbi:hypothetical protein [Gorillibacterium massiliense]|uniref:hypothetical protein n=1 Tax=Gorillibacterium massiliense TaxID=1280390 RepID=UPI0004B90035|nr:hypothetical protein [Gorillibacterium massiliense]
MLTSLKDGWKAAWSQGFLLVFLFVYRLAWAIALYRCIQSIVVPLLQRFPTEKGSQEQARLFLAEAEFRLTKTDISHSYLLLFLILLLIRAALTPLLNAGIFYSLRHTKLNTGYRFFKGMKSLALPFYLFYLAQLILLLPAVFYVWPDVKAALASYNPDSFINSGLLLKLGGLLAYSYVLRLLFLHLQLGKTAEAPLLGTFARSLLRLPFILAIALIILLLSTLMGGAVMAITLWKASLWTLILYQAYNFVRTYMSLWGLTAQQKIFETGTLNK